jgi:hypothetical protein
MRIRESVGSQTEVISGRDFERMFVGLPYDFTRITAFHKNDPATEMCSSQGTYDTYGSDGTRGRLVASGLLKEQA